jgi:hypothetical protein
MRGPRSLPPLRRGGQVWAGARRPEDLLPVHDQGSRPTGWLTSGLHVQVLVLRRSSWFVPQVSLLEPYHHCVTAMLPLGLLLCSLGLRTPVAGALVTVPSLMADAATAQVTSLLRKVTPTNTTPTPPPPALKVSLYTHAHSNLWTLPTGAHSCPQQVSDRKPLEELNSFLETPSASLFREQGANSNKSTSR